MSDDFPKYDTMSFNSGCYGAIRANGPVKNKDGDPIPGVN
jgi:hypothetical protein